VIDRVWRTVSCYVDNARIVCLLICLCNCRKRKTPEACVRPRVVEITWDVDDEKTSALMKDMGVSFLTWEQNADVCQTVAVSQSPAVELVHPRVSDPQIQYSCTMPLWSGST